MKGDCGNHEDKSPFDPKLVGKLSDDHSGVFLHTYLLLHFGHKCMSEAHFRFITLDRQVASSNLTNYLFTVAEHNLYTFSSSLSTFGGEKNHSPKLPIIKACVSLHDCLYEWQF